MSQFDNMHTIIFDILTNIVSFHSLLTQRRHVYKDLRNYDCRGHNELSNKKQEVNRK